MKMIKKKEKEKRGSRRHSDILSLRMHLTFLMTFEPL